MIGLDLSKTKEKLTVSIYSSDELLYDGAVEAISSVNYKGPFDILSLHSNFISIIKDKVTLREPTNTVKEFTFKQAIMHCYKNHANIYLGM